MDDAQQSDQDGLALPDGAVELTEDEQDESSGAVIPAAAAIGVAKWGAAGTVGAAAMAGPVNTAVDNLTS